MYNIEPDHYTRLLIYFIDINELSSARNINFCQSQYKFDLYYKILHNTI